MTKVQSTSTDLNKNVQTPGGLYEQEYRIKCK